MTFNQASIWAHERNLTAMSIRSKIKNKKVVTYQLLGKMNKKVIAESHIGWKDVIHKYETD